LFWICKKEEKKVEIWLENLFEAFFFLVVFVGLGLNESASKTQEKKLLVNSNAKS
jgi:hypothetical protein